MENQTSVAPLTEDERRQVLVDWNQTTAEYPGNVCIHGLFEAQVLRTPARQAVRSGEETLTYVELNEQANQLAHHLAGLGVKSGGLVGLCVDRGVRALVGLMAILKAGAAYVPLSPDSPKARLMHQLEGAAALVTEARLEKEFAEFQGPKVSVDGDISRWSSNPRINPNVAGSSEDLVYVIFTSGSTGLPKGVAVRHRNLVNYAAFISRLLKLETFPEGLQFGLVSTMTADLGNTCLFPSLISGGCLHAIPQQTTTDSERMKDYMTRYAVDVLKIVPSHLNALLASHAEAKVLPGRYLVTGGESLSPQLVERIRGCGATCEIVNHYGPTETTVGSLVFPLKGARWEPGARSIPIGRPIANTQVYILDSDLQPVPVNSDGEIYIAGDGVSAGYLNRPELTAERFIPNPFLPEGTMYRTGDLGRFLPDGNVEFIGRADDQVKIRGYRVEPGEIEATLARYPGVVQTFVTARLAANGDMRLIAYVVASCGADDLRAHVRERLPEYMIPQAILLLPALPLNANGKVDRQRLPDPEEFQAEGETHAIPVTSTEKVIAGIWSEVLGTQVGLGQDFFEVGGHSLAGIQVVARIRDHFNVTLEFGAIFDHPTIEGLAREVDAAMSGQSDAPADMGIIPVSRESFRVR